MQALFSHGIVDAADRLANAMARGGEEPLELFSRIDGHDPGMYAVWATACAMRELTELLSIDVAWDVGYHKQRFVIRYIASDGGRQAICFPTEPTEDDAKLFLVTLKLNS